MSCPRLKGVRCVRATGYPENKPNPKTGEGLCVCVCVCREPHHANGFSSGSN